MLPSSGIDPQCNIFLAVRYLNEHILHASVFPSGGWNLLMESNVLSVSGVTSDTVDSFT